jgi:hypothetical protein
MKSYVAPSRKNPLSKKMAIDRFCCMRVSAVF